MQVIPDFSVVLPAGVRCDGNRVVLVQFHKFTNNSNHRSKYLGIFALVASSVILFDVFLEFLCASDFPGFLSSSFLLPT